MFGHPRIYFEEFEKLSEEIVEREELIGAVASIYRLTPQHAREVHHEWEQLRQRTDATLAL